MKKKLAVIAGFLTVICFSLAACGGGSDADLSESKYVGTWVAVSMSLGDESGDFNEGDWIITLNADGTGIVTSKEDGGKEEISDIRWSLTDDGFRTKGDMKLDFTDDGDGIKASILGADVHFVREDDIGPDDGAPDIGTQYGYMGQDPVECAVWKYLAEDVAANYQPEEGTVTVPVVQIIRTEEGEDGDTHVYGDFWVYNYKVDGDTLLCVSGGAHPGMMHVTKDGDDYAVTSFDAVKDGGEYEPSAREIFGDSYDQFVSISSDSDAREKLRAQGLADYVKTNGLSVTKYQDEGWDPVELAL